MKELGHYYLIIYLALLLSDSEKGSHLIIYLPALCEGLVRNISGRDSFNIVIYYSPVLSPLLVATDEGSILLMMAVAAVKGSVQTGSSFSCFGIVVVISNVSALT